MASYYYLISSLPMLRTQGEPPMDYATFLSQCRSAVSEGTYKTLEELTLEELREVSDLFESDVYDALNLENCMALRGSYGGPAVSETKRQIEEITAFIKARSK